MSEYFLVLIPVVPLRYYTGQAAINDQTTFYNYFRDVSVMIFFGFGYLMTFLRRGGCVCSRERTW